MSSRRARAPRRLSRWLLTASLLAAACGGGNDPLPAASEADPVPSGGVSVTSVSSATRDGAVWLTRSSAVTVGGRAPPDSTVEAFPADGGRLAAATTAGADGAYALALPLAEGSNVFALRARAPGAAPGPSTQLRIFRRTTPPSPFTVGQLPQVTNADSVLVQGTTEADIVVVVRVTGGAAPVEVTRPAGAPGFEVRVPLRRDQENRLEITGEELAGNRTAPIVRVVVQDSSAPPAPELDAIGGPVGSTSAVLTGRARGAARVEAAGPSGVASAGVRGDDSFALGVELTREGENAFGVVAIDAAGNRSAAAPARVHRDLTPPGLPSDVRVSGHPASQGASVTLADPVLAVEGRAEPGATVGVSAAGTPVSGTAGSEDGGFRVSLTLPGDGVYPVEVRATDAAGNTGAPLTFTVVLDTAAPPAEEPSAEQPGTEEGRAGDRQSLAAGWNLRAA